LINLPADFIYQAKFQSVIQPAGCHYITNNSPEGRCKQLAGRAYAVSFLFADKHPSGFPVAQRLPVSATHSLKDGCF
jgi:hypothetical protein